MSFYGIMGRRRGDNRFKAFDYANQRFVTNVIYSTIWTDKSFVTRLAIQLGKTNPDYEFKVAKR